jgi:hypothetical protein
MLAAGRFDCAAVLTSSSKNSRHLSSSLGTKLTAVRANQALARYILFFRQQHNEARRGNSNFPIYELETLQLGQVIK